MTGCFLVDYITSQGYRVEIRPGSVTLISLKDGTMPDPFPTVAAAFQWVTR